MHIIRVWQRFQRDESATTAVEYAVMLAFILSVIIGAITSFGLAEGGLFGRVDTQMKAHGVN